MERYDPEYDRSYGRDYRGWSERERFEPAPSYGRRWGRWAGRRELDVTRRRREPGYGGEFRGEERPGYGTEFGGPEPTGYRPRRRLYGREYMGYGLGFGTAGYGREFAKTRWEVDYGDPFRDRERGTPIRMIRGEYGEFGEYGREFPGRERFRERAAGYEPEYRPRTRRYRY